MADSLAYQLFHAATDWIRDDIDFDKVDTQVPSTPGCACCGRPWQQTENPERSYCYQYSSGMATELYCEACYTPRVASPTALGVERFAGGNPDNPVSGKLGMLPGSCGVITPDGSLHLGLPPGFIAKYREGRYGKAGLIHPYPNGMALLAHLLETGKVEPGMIYRGIVFVETWGRKADTLMAGLRTTRSLSEVWCSSDGGATMLDLQSIIETGYWLQDQGILDKAEKPSFWTPIKAATEGKPNGKAVEKWAVGVQKLGVDPQALINQLPVDPHSRMRVGPVLKEIAPAIRKGIL